MPNAPIAAVAGAGKPYELLLAETVAEFYDDPYGFILMAWPWGEPGGPLEHYDGLDVWQTDLCREIEAQLQSRTFNGHDPVLPVRIAVSSGHGIGKALSTRTEIPTPAGLRRFGALKVGDQVFAEDGTATDVTGVYPQGQRALYRVTFDDGSSVEADADHLWKVRGRSERRNKRATWRNMTTADLMRAGVTRSNGSAQARQWEIPQQGAARFPSRPVTIDPYTLGVWIGDGCRNSSRITSNDPEVVAQIRSRSERVTPQKHGMAWHVSGLSPRLRALRIADRYSYQKSVPTLYMENDSKVRADVLRGLLDTDGECGKQGAICFSSTSRALADDVVWLARSLGGKARIQPTTKRPTYRGPDGERLQGRPCWRATLTMPADFQSFYIARKQARVTPVESRYLSRWIASVEPIGTAEAVCITVAHTSKCFLANDFIVTHNSALIAMLAHWLMATRPYMVGTMTASSLPQLDTKTWPALVEWNRTCRCGHWFEINTERMYRKGHKDEWFIAKQSSKEENAASFAGQHKARSSPVYFFDEDAEICDLVHQVAEGGLTDGEPFIFRFGNMTVSQGSFYEAVFGKMRHRWHPIIVDSRTAKFTNKQQIDEWIADYGVDSDFVRVRVLGLPPAAGEFQFIDRQRVQDAQKRPIFELGDTPLVAGCDLAWGGGDDNVIRFRRGSDARTIPPIRIKGEFTRDPAVLTAKLADVLTRDYYGHRVSMLFLDSAGIAGPIAARLREMGHRNVQEVNFGADSPDAKCRYMRDFMWSKMKHWLLTAAIDGDPQLETDLTGPSIRPDTRQRVWLESKESMKKRGVDSPDDGDALALTFAAVVTSVRRPVTRVPMATTGDMSWAS